MVTPSYKNNKESIRKELKSVMAGLNNQRRFEAAEGLMRHLPLFCAGFSFVLSFASFHLEIDTHRLNELLAQEGRLLLPRLCKEGVELYLVSDSKSQLVKSSLGILEPDPTLCKAVSEERVTLALIPGLGFDKEGERLGYGKGVYDRLLPKLINAQRVGIGFKEQGREILPRESHDQRLSKVLLF